MTPTMAWRPAMGVFCLICGLFAGTAPALANGQDFDAAQSEAYVHYREAAFYTRTGNTPVAGLALDEFVMKWAALVDRYADSPPAVYASDQKFGETLREILTRAESGLEALDADDPETAREAISPIRGMLGELRRRSGVVTWSDLVDELSAAMDVLARYRREVKDLDDADAVTRVREQAAAVAALFVRCNKEAAPDIAGDPEFRRLVDGAAGSMEKLMKSLETKDSLLFRIGIGELRSYERIMYLRFG
jgi:hypothetical protein